MAPASSVAADTVTLETGVTSVRIMLAWSTIVTTGEAALLTLEADTDVSAGWEQLESTARETTEMNACTTPVETMAAVLTRLETMTAIVTKRGKERTVMSTMCHLQAELM